MRIVPFAVAPNASRSSYVNVSVPVEPANASYVIDVLVRSAMRPRLGADEMPVSIDRVAVGVEPVERDVDRRRPSPRTCAR